VGNARARAKVARACVAVVYLTRGKESGCSRRAAEWIGGRARGQNPIFIV
jgi:hypothetical protein